MIHGMFDDLYSSARKNITTEFRRDSLNLLKELRSRGNIDEVIHEITVALIADRICPRCYTPEAMINDCTTLDDTEIFLSVCPSCGYESVDGEHWIYGESD